MSGERLEFCDTNVLVYAYDVSAGEKRELAKRLLDRLWSTRSGLLSVQVLQELYVTLTRKLPISLSHQEAGQLVADLSTWRVVEPTREDVLEAIDSSARWGISFWDSMLLTAARKGGATLVWSEDFQDGEDYGGLVVTNPFRR